jgi:hypothetical protein
VTLNQLKGALAILEKYVDPDDDIFTAHHDWGHDELSPADLHDLEILGWALE